MIRTAVTVLTAAMVAVLGACTSQAERSSPSGITAPRTTASGTTQSSHAGVVIGLAEACAGPAPASTRPVTVFAWRNGRIVAREVVPYVQNGGRYRFVLAPGRYLLSAPRSGDRPQLVAVSAQTITVNFPNLCN